MYQHIVVVGNVGRDPELRYLPSGDPVANFSVAVNRKWTGRDGQPQEKTTWFRVNVFGRQAETVNQYVTKGQMVLVEGEIDASAWTAQDGTARASLELRARNVRFLGRRGEEGEFAGQGGGYQRERPAKAGGREEEDWMQEGEAPGGPEEIPF